MKRVKIEIEMNGLTSKFIALFVALLFVGMNSNTVEAQGGFMLETEQQKELDLAGSFHLEENSKTGYLVLTARIPEGCYIYSLTQKDNPPPSKIEIAKSDAYQVTGTFRPETPATVIERDPVFEARLEKHTKSLRFFIPLQLADSATAEDLTIKMRFNGQMCSEEDGTCQPIQNKVIDAKFQGYFQRVAERNTENGTFRR